MCRREQPLEKEVLCWKERKDVKIFSSQGNTFSNREERIPTRCNNIDGLLSIADIDY